MWFEIKFYLFVFEKPAPERRGEAVTTQFWALCPEFYIFHTN